MYIILVYDICLDNNGAKVLRNVFKLCKKYLIHIQNSVFEGEITEAELYKLKTEFRRYVRPECDSIIIFKSRQEQWLDKEFLGDQDDLTNNFI